MKRYFEILEGIKLSREMKNAMTKEVKKQMKLGKDRDYIKKALDIQFPTIPDEEKMGVMNNCMKEECGT